MGNNETKRTMRPAYATGTIVLLDNDMANHSTVEVVDQTPGRLFTTVKPLGSDGKDCWSVMSYRLTTE